MNRRAFQLSALLALAATVFVGSGVAAHFQSVPGAIARAFGFRGGIAAIDGVAASACPAHGLPCGSGDRDPGSTAPHDPTTCDTCTALFLAGFQPTVAPAPIGPVATLELVDARATSLRGNPVPLRTLWARPPPAA